MVQISSDPTVSVIVPVGQRQSDVMELYAEYVAGLKATGRRYEIIFVVDGPHERFTAGLQQLIRDGEPLTIVMLTRSFGEATALMAGFEHASGELIVTLPAYHQIDGADIGKLLTALDSADFATGCRWPRAGGPFEAFRRQVFHSLIAWVTKLRFRDLGCGARAMHRRVLEEIS